MCFALSRQPERSLMTLTAWAACQPYCNPPGAVVIAVDTHPTRNMIASAALAKDKTVRVWVDEAGGSSHNPAMYTSSPTLMNCSVGSEGEEIARVPDEPLHTLQPRH